MHLAECGFCEHGEQARLIGDGELEIGGRLPVNTDGGLIANGEPIGASGLRQIDRVRAPAPGPRRRPTGAGRAEDRLHPGVRRPRDQCLLGAVPMTGLPLLERAAGDPGGWAIRSDAHGKAAWGDLAEATLRLAGAIDAYELGRGRRLLVIARNRPSTLLAHAAAALGGAASVPVSFHLTPGEIEYIADEAGARLAFVDSTTEAATREAMAGRDVVVVRLPDDGIAGGELDFFVGDRPPIELRPGQAVLPNLLFTSGTTGRPKSVQLPPKTIGNSPDLAGFVEHITAHRLAKLSTHLVVGPLYHNGPLTAVRLLLAGVPIVVHERFDAEATLAAIDQHRIESSIMVPTHFVRCLALPQRSATATTCRRCARSPTPAASARSTSSGR